MTQWHRPPAESMATGSALIWIVLDGGGLAPWRSGAGALAFFWPYELNWYEKSLKPVQRQRQGARAPYHARYTNIQNGVEKIKKG